jgi:hypothetical protein
MDQSGVAPRRSRARGRGQWSGAERKYKFLCECLADDNLPNRLDHLRAVSPWWPFLEATQSGSEDGNASFLCPTYVLYDALSPEGRGK